MSEVNKSIIRNARRMLDELGIPKPHDLIDMCAGVVSARNFATRLKYRPKLRRRLLTWACEEEQRVHAEVAAAICCVGTP